MSEAKTVDNIFEGVNLLKDVQYENGAKESWLLSQLQKSQYEYIYFATHGVPSAEAYFSYYVQYKDKKVLNNERKYMEAQAIGISPLYGFLYMEAGEPVTFEDNQKILESNDDGFLTIAEIMALDKKSFEHTNLVVLSACNTGVTFALKTLQDTEII